ncbi:Ribonuclease P protein component 2 [uncultured archaeon]|nr:Ribonuclease P protein component 2 [uncultured archaeon]
MPPQKKSLNPIPSSLRGKKRYVKFRFICSKPLAERDAWQSILRAFGGLFGSQGMAEQRLWLIKWFPEKNEGILRCSLQQEENVKAGILFVQKVGPETVVPLILKVSGSVKKLKQ